MSSILFLLLAVACCLGGASALARRRRVDRWPVEKAHVVHCMEALPFGDPLPPPSEQLVVVIRRDGTEEELVSRTLHQPGSPSVTWFAELVYFVDGVAHEADVALREPVAGTVELLVNPRDPSQYLTGPPSAWAALAPFALGVVFLSLAF